LYDSLDFSMDLNRNLNIAIDAALKGGVSIMEVYDGDDFQIEKKADESPLTLADSKAHNSIVEILERTEYPILSEEGKHLAFKDRKEWNVFWLVDPLDGTKEFIKRNGEFTVNIALIENGHPVLGVVYVPVSGSLYFASKSIGAFKLDDALNKLSHIEKDAISLPYKKWDKRHLNVVGSRSHMSEETMNYVQNLKDEYESVEIVSKGSSLKLCLVAEGEAQLYPRFAPTMEWDTGAGQAIVEFSGGLVLNYPDLKPLRYNKENLRNPWFIVGLNEDLIKYKLN
tara:strand:- start:34 stop:882 length:849 start_codon:yes stop_codon:yes gene_type:complete